MRKSHLLWCLVPIAFLANASLTVAASPAERCEARKLRAAAKESRDLLFCRGKGATGNETEMCFTRAVARRERAFAIAESLGGCVTTGDSTAIGERSSQFEQTVLGALVPPGGIVGSLCTKAKLQAEGAKLLATARAHAAELLRPNRTQLDNLLARASSRFDAAFARAETLSNCKQLGDAPLESERVDVWIDDLLKRLVPTCGDDFTAGAEVCDGSDAASCPGLCAADCTCPICGDGVRQVGEACDGSDAALCPGSCQANCRCPGAPICGDTGVDAPETCDGLTCPNPGLGQGGGCLPPGNALECRCCVEAGSGTFCSFGGFPTAPCCEGATCVALPIALPHSGGACRPSCTQDSECGSMRLCLGGGCSGQLQPCTQPTDCPASYVCRTDVGLCIECAWAGSCP